MVWKILTSFSCRRARKCQVSGLNGRVRLPNHLETSAASVGAEVLVACTAFWGVRRAVSTAGKLSDLMNSGARVGLMDGDVSGGRLRKDAERVSQSVDARVMSFVRLTSGAALAGVRPRRPQKLRCRRRARLSAAEVGSKASSRCSPLQCSSTRESTLPRAQRIHIQSTFDTCLGE